MKNSLCLVIPARLESNRLKNKLLKKINSKFLIEYSIKNSLESSFINKIFMISPNHKIYSMVEEKNKINFLKSIGRHNCATSRVAQTLSQVKKQYIFVLFGDEPLITSKMIDNFILKVLKDKKSNVWNATSKFYNKKELKNKSIVKCYLDKSSNIYQLSRKFKEVENKYIKKSVGLFCFKSNALKKINKLGLKKDLENIEQNSILSLGLKIKSIDIKKQILSVNTKKDLKKISNIINNQIIN